MQISESIKKPAFIYHFLVLLLLCFLTYKIYEIDEAASDAYFVAELARVDAEEAKTVAADANSRVLKLQYSY